jgi:multiple sugar transport system substrate-binding protein
MVRKALMNGAVAVSLLLGVAGCSSGSSSGNGTNPSASNGGGGGTEHKFVFWDKSEYIPEYNTLEKQFVEQWGQQNHVKVEYVVIPPDQLKAKLMASIEAGNPPDLVVTDDFMAKQFAGMNALADVSDVMGKLNFTDSAKKIAFMQGGWYLVPQAMLAPGMYVRKDVFDEHQLPLPKTWDDIAKDAKIINNPQQNFYALGFPMGASGGGDAEGMMRALILDYGGQIVDQNENVTINSPQTLKALEFMSQLFKDGLVPQSAVTWDDNGNNKAYQAGTVGIVFNSGSILSYLQKNNPDLLKKTAVLPWPSGPSGEFTPGGGNVFAVFKQGKDNADAKKFVADFFNKDYYNGLVQKMAPMWQPTISGLDQDPFWQKPETKGWLESSQHLVPSTYPGPSDAAGSKAQSEQLIVKAMQRIIVNHQDPQQSLNQLNSDMKQVFGK